jgi:hypothetical protein
VYPHRPAADADPEPGPEPDRGLADGAGPDRLREEIAQLKQAMRSRPVIDQARGVLMAVTGCSADEAWQTIVTVSQHANVKLRVVAQHLVAAAQGDPVPSEVRDHLARALAPVSRQHRPAPD